MKLCGAKYQCFAQRLFAVWWIMTLKMSDTRISVMFQKAEPAIRSRLISVFSVMFFFGTAHNEPTRNYVCKCLTQIRLPFIGSTGGSGSANAFRTLLMCCIVIPHLTQRYLNIKSGLLGIQMCSGYK